MRAYFRRVRGAAWRTFRAGDVTVNSLVGLGLALAGRPRTEWGRAGETVSCALARRVMNGNATAGELCVIRVLGKFHAGHTVERIVEFVKGDEADAFPAG